MSVFRRDFRSTQPADLDGFSYGGCREGWKAGRIEGLSESRITQITRISRITLAKRWRLAHQTCNELDSHKPGDVLGFTSISALGRGMKGQNACFRE